jgi:hypothetical protein
MTGILRIAPGAITDTTGNIPPTTSILGIGKSPSGPGGEGKSNDKVVVLGLVAVEADGAEFGEEVGVFGGEVEEAGFEEDAEVGEEGAAGDVAAVGVAAWGDGDGDEFGVEVGADDEFGEGGAGSGGVDEEDLFGRGESVEEVAEDGDEQDVLEAEGEALGMLDAEAGFGEVDEVSVVKLAGEFEFGFEDDEGGVVASLAEVEADVEVGAVGAQGLFGRSEIHATPRVFECVFGVVRMGSE